MFEVLYLRSQFYFVLVLEWDVWSIISKIAVLLCVSPRMGCLKYYLRSQFYFVLVLEWDV